ncbi:ROK family transcriptional regulator [Oceanobacillus rekensis]|uniref:ROK family transcriptional regulator n=1 Tax=Oceanobacillus rekensis TaxID=937927 RepID=UPI000B4399D3|nr:ROK family transcriptional regulator [Oceanobacillus rekensis]
MDSGSTKHVNKRKVLQYIQNKQGHSRSDIAKALKISKPTVSTIVDELLEEGWIREKESEKASSSGGRKPFRISFNENASYIVGIDIGGTSVEIAVLNLTGKMIRKIAFDTQKHIGKDFIHTIADHVNHLLRESGFEIAQILGVGVGVPGITDVANGIVIDAPSLNWKHTPLKSQLENLLHCPVYIDNDVNVAVLGEWWKGAGETNNNMLMITLGTGIGCGLIINGDLYRGASYAAGEIGYMVTDKDAAHKEYDQTFAGYGFLDSHVGGPSITKRMLHYLGESDKASENWSAQKIFQLAIDGDEMALKVIHDFLSHLSYALINVISIINPQQVVLGGGISKSMGSFLPYLSATMNKHLPLQTEVSITTVEDVSLIGAGYLLLKEHDSILKV